MTITELKREPGVNDLDPRTKTAFAAAIKAENDGDPAKAEKWLNKAVQFEGQPS